MTAVGDTRLHAAFWRKVQPDDTTGCWIWTAATNGYEYGQIRVDGVLHAAHRLSYSRLVGPILDGLHIDHLCRRTRCVNPAHMEPVTQGENTRRGLVPLVNGALNRAKVRCPQGHAYDAENTYTSRGKRYCRICRHAASVRHRRRTIIDPAVPDA